MDSRVDTNIFDEEKLTALLHSLAEAEQAVTEALPEGVDAVMLPGQLTPFLLGVARRAVHSLIRQLNAETAQLEQSNRELELFAYLASHDLQEPLRAVAGYGQLLERKYGKVLGQEGKVFLSGIIDGTVRMQKMIESLLVFSRISTREPCKKNIDSRLPLKKAVRNLEATIRDTEAGLTYGDLPMVTADPDLLTQVFQNLIGNALKFHGKAKPDIAIHAGRQEAAWQFAVKDNGIGIDPQYAERIFTNFQRLHTRSEYPGEGIGLALCKRIIERHEGKIWVESELGVGSVFYFTIPCNEKKE